MPMCLCSFYADNRGSSLGKTHQTAVDAILTDSMNPLPSRFARNPTHNA